MTATASAFFDHAAAEPARRRAPRSTGGLLPLRMRLRVRRAEVLGLTSTDAARRRTRRYVERASGCRRPRLGLPLAGSGSSSWLLFFDDAANVLGDVFGDARRRGRPRQGPAIAHVLAVRGDVRGRRRAASGTRAPPGGAATLGLQQASPAGRRHSLLVRARAGQRPSATGLALDRALLWVAIASLVAVPAASCSGCALAAGAWRPRSTAVQQLHAAAVTRLGAPA